MTILRLISFGLEKRVASLNVDELQGETKKVLF